MKKLLVFGVLNVFLLSLAIISCNKDNSTTNYLDKADCTGIDPNTNTYTNSIKTILNEKCATSGCHADNSRAAGINLSTYSTAKSAFENTQCLCANKNS